MSSRTRKPAVEGWFTDEDRPVLLGSRCTTCGTTAFPKARFTCHNPTCAGTSLEEVRLSRTGTIWSFTDAQYRPPPPYIPRTEPFRPFAIAAVELPDERMVVLGQVADGYSVQDLAVGQAAEVVVEVLYADGDTDYIVYRWRPVAEARS
jgi:uncharacterized protein